MARQRSGAGIFRTEGEDLAPACSPVLEGAARLAYDEALVMMMEARLRPLQSSVFALLRRVAAIVRAG
jgi:hypothetical protein